MALIAAAAILLGMFVPYWGSGFAHASLKDESSILAMFVPTVIVAGIGATVAISANRAGAFVMVGFGLPFAAFQLLLIRILTFSEGALQAKGGFVLWTIAAAGLTLLYVATVPSARRRTDDEPLVPAVWTVVALIGAAILTVGQLTPPFDGQSVWDHVSLGDGWLGFANIVLIGSMPVTAIFLAIHRTQPTALAFWGCAAFYFMIWFVQTARIGSSRGFQEPLLGKFPPTTAGILVCIGAATIAAFGPWFWGNRRPDTTSPVQAALIVLLLAILVMTIVGFSERSQRLDRFGFASSDTPEEVVVT